MPKLITHKGLAEHFGVTEATAQRRGKRGDYGEAVIAYPAHYQESTALKLGAVAPDHRIKLTDDDVRDICERRAAGETCAALAQEYGVSNSYISRLAHNKRRADR